MRFARLALICLLLSNYAHATWSFVRAAGVTCTNTLSNCVTTISPTAGDVMVVMAGITINDPATTITDTGGTTYTVPSGCAIQEPVSGGTVSCGYSLSVLSGVTSITVNRATTTSASWQVRILEFSSTVSASVALDAVGTTVASTPATTVTGPALTLTGTNDVVVQMARGTTVTAVSAPYTLVTSFSGNNMIAYVINSSTGPAPTWTQSSARAAMSGIAIKEGGGGVQPAVDVITQNRFP